MIMIKACLVEPPGKHSIQAIEDKICDKQQVTS